MDDDALEKSSERVWRSVPTIAFFRFELLSRRPSFSPSSGKRLANAWRNFKLAAEANDLGSLDIP